MATWNADKPAVGNQISADIPDIEENFQELHDVVQAITNGTLGTTTAADFKVDVLTSPAMWAEQRSQFVYKDADEIYINAGAYHHVGTVSQVVYWSSQLTIDIGSPDASDWYYLYIDDSAVVSNGTNLLTASEFLFSNTEPAWSDAKHGWYNGSDRCIFAVLTDGSSNIKEFFHDGGNLVKFADDITTNSSGNITTSFADANALSIPKFSTRGLVHFAWTYVDASSTVLWRTNGQTGSTGTRCVSAVAGSTFNFNTCDVITDSNQIIEVKESATSNNLIDIWTTGWYFPAGM